MATALHSPRPSNGSASLRSEAPLQSYPLRLTATEFDLTDHRYPTLAPAQNEATRLSSTGIFGPATNYLLWDQPPPSADSTARPRTTLPPPGLPADWTIEGLGDDVARSKASPEMEQKDERAHQRQSPVPQSPTNDAAFHPLPPGARAARNATERLGDDTLLQPPAERTAESRPAIDTSDKNLPWDNARYTSPVIQPASSQRPSVPGTGAAVEALGDAQLLPAPVAFNQTGGYPIPNLSRPRAPAQQPTYVNPGAPQNPLNPMLTNPRVPPEEVCLECAMRDQDMADVDVTSPGVWERDSDVMFEDLKRREREEQFAGMSNTDPSRPRTEGNPLTEPNLKLWLSMNPREPQSRQQNLENYVKLQRTLLEAEALAHARAIRESRQLDSMMRDTFSQLRRSAYETGATAAPVDDTGGVRIKPPNVHGPTTRSHSRDVTLLENGMIVEHVDVRKEEKEERERKRKEERRERSRARKSSRSSAVDVNSVYSIQSGGGLYVDNTPSNNRYSHSLAGRPASVLTAPPLTDRGQSLPQGYSQGMSDAQSLGPPSPRSRFFGFRNMSQSWRSQDSLAISGVSGSMVDMHLALDGTRDRTPYGPSPRISQYWPPPSAPADLRAETKSEKKRSGFSKFWRMLTMNKSDLTLNLRNNPTRHVDDAPLPPPPPMSSLVGRRPGDWVGSAPRHASTPSLPSITSPRTALFSPSVSPGTAPSSLVPSPDREVMLSASKHNKENQDQMEGDDAGKATPTRAQLSANSDNDTRQVGKDSPGNASSLRPMPFPSVRPHSTFVREKSLPPLPAEAEQSASSPMTPSPAMRQSPAGLAPRPQTVFVSADPFRDSNPRSQSFGGTGANPFTSTSVTTNVPFLPYQQPLLNPYDEFGATQPQFQDNLDVSSTKRRSRFNIGNLLPKKQGSSKKGHLLPSPNNTQDNSTHDGDDVMSNGYATSASKHSAISAAPKSSVAPRRAIDELVLQDPEFIAYRYPSGDQGLALQR